MKDKTIECNECDWEGEVQGDSCPACGSFIYAGISYAEYLALKNDVRKQEELNEQLQIELKKEKFVLLGKLIATISQYDFVDEEGHGNTAKRTILAIIKDVIMNPDDYSKVTKEICCTECKICNGHRWREVFWNIAERGDDGVIDRLLIEVGLINKNEESSND